MTKLKFIEISDQGKVIKVLENSEDMKLEDVLEEFKAFLLALTYSPELVERIELREKYE